MGSNSNLRSWQLTFVCISVMLFLAACSGSSTPRTSATQTKNITYPVIEITASPFPTETPTPQPIGSPDNPVIMGLVTPTNNTGAADSDLQIASFLTKQTGYSFQVVSYDNYPSLISDIENGKVMAAWLPPFTYLATNQDGLVNVALVSNHFGVYSYGTMFLANIESGFTSYFDANTNQDSADASQALHQLDGKRPCLVEPKSASGYVVPLGILSTQEISFQEPVLTQTFSAVIRSLYIQQICDYGATYAISGDPRTASSIQNSFPDVMSKIIIIWRSDPVIPNLSLVYHTNLPKGISQLVTDALVNWVKTDEGKKALTDANQYDIADLKPVDDSYYDPLRAYLKASKVDLDSLVGR